MKRKSHASAIDTHAVSTWIVAPKTFATHFQFVRSFFIIVMKAGIAALSRHARGSTDLDGTNIAAEWSPHAPGGAMSRTRSFPFAAIVHRPGAEIHRRIEPSAEATGGLS